MALFRVLTDVELDRVAAGVRLAGDLVGSEGPPQIADLQVLYDLLAQDTGSPTRAIEALGYAFGQCLLRHEWLHWAMMLDDDYGDEIAVAVRGRNLGCSPLSMLRNRLEDREPCDLADLMSVTANRLRQLGQQASSA